LASDDAPTVEEENAALRRELEMLKAETRS